jgi:hypothetical protein
MAIAWFILEMIADWRGAGKAQGKGDNTVAWYAENKGKMQLDEWTRSQIERLVYGMEDDDTTGET